MPKKEFSWRRFAKRTGLVISIVLIVLAIAMALLWNVLKEDHAYVIRKLKERAAEKYDAQLELAGYTIDFIDPFPIFNIKIKAVSLANNNFPQTPVLRFNSLDTDFDAWALLTGNFNVHPFELDSVWLNIFKDENGINNLNFGNAPRTKPLQLNLKLKKLPKVSVNFLDFNHNDLLKQESQKATISSMQISAQQNDQNRWIANLNGDAAFDHLIFKPEEGAFLSDTRGILDLNISIDKKQNAIVLEKGTLKTAANEFDISSKFTIEEKNKVELNINSSGVLMSAIKPLLSEKINQALKDINIDRPINAEFSLNSTIDPEIKAAVNLSFETIDKSRIEYDQLFVTQAAFKGSFSNDCDHDGVGNEGMGCLLIDTLSGDFLGIISSEIVGSITELSNPKLSAVGKAAFDFPKMNDFFSEKDKFTFKTGEAIVNFTYNGNLKKILDAPFDEQNIKMKGDVNFKNVSLASSAQNSPVLSGFLNFDDQNTSIDTLDVQWMGSKISVQGKLNNLPEFLFYNDEALLTELDINIDHIDLSGKERKSQKTKQVKQTNIQAYHEIDRIVKKVARNINGNIKIGIDKFSLDSFFLSNLITEIKLRSPRDAAAIDTTIISLDKFQANFMGETPMTFDLDLSQDEEINVLLAIDIPSAQKPVNYFLPKYFSIDNGELGVAITTEVPLRSLLDTTQFLKGISFDGNILFNQVNLEIGLDSPFKQIQGELQFDEDYINFDDIDFGYRDSPFHLNGDIKHYSAIANPDLGKAIFDLHLAGDHFDLRPTSSKNPIEPRNNKPSIIPRELFQSLDTIYQFSTGKIDLNIDRLITNNQTLHPLIIEAQLINDGDDFQLQVDSFNIGFSKDDYVKGSAKITNPDSPKINASFLAHLKFNKLGDLLTSQYIEFNDGFFSLDLDYEAPLFDTLNAENYLLKANIEGKAKIVDGNVYYNYRDFEFDDINCNFDFNQRAVFIKKLEMKINGNQLYANGESTDFFPFFILPDQYAAIDLNVSSPKFDFGKFKAPDNINKLKDDPLDGLASPSNPGGDPQLLKTISYIDQLLNRSSLRMNTDLEEIVFGKFNGRNIHGLIQMQSDTVRLENLSMSAADGTFALNGLISEVVNHEPNLEMDLKIENSNLQEIFRQFDNFGSETFKHEKFNGIATAKLNFNSKVNSDYTLRSESMIGDLDLMLAGGEMREFAFLKDLKGFIFKNRKLSQLTIDTLDINAHLRGNNLFFDEFEFHSSSFDFSARGIYSLDSIEHTEFLMSVPIGNLFKRHVARETLGQAEARRKGPPIHIKGIYKRDKFRFKWKVFHRRKSEYLRFREEEQ